MWCDRTFNQRNKAPKRVREEGWAKFEKGGLTIQGVFIKYRGQELSANYAYGNAGANSDI